MMADARNFPRVTRSLFALARVNSFPTRHVHTVKAAPGATIAATRAFNKMFTLSINRAHTT